MIPMVFVESKITRDERGVLVNGRPLSEILLENINK